MSTDTGEPESELPPSPFPDIVVYAWLSVLEGSIAAGLAIFSISLLEEGNLIPDILAEWSVGMGVFVVVSVGLFVRRQYLS